VFVWSVGTLFLQFQIYIQIDNFKNT